MYWSLCSFYVHILRPLFAYKDVSLHASICLLLCVYIYLSPNSEEPFFQSTRCKKYKTTERRTGWEVKYYLVQFPVDSSSSTAKTSTNVPSSAFTWPLWVSASIFSAAVRWGDYDEVTHHCLNCSLFFLLEGMWAPLCLQVRASALHNRHLFQCQLQFRGC